MRILDKGQMTAEVVYKEGIGNGTFSKLSKTKEPWFLHLKAWEGNSTLPICTHHRVVCNIK